PAGLPFGDYEFLGEVERVDVGLGAAVVGGDGDRGGGRGVREPFEGDGGAGHVAGFGERHFQPFPDRTFDTAGPPRGGGGLVECRVRGPARVTPAGESRGAGFGGGGGDRGDPFVADDGGVGLPGGVDDVGSGHVAVEFFGGGEGG